jgi:hypothetical protein
MKGAYKNFGQKTLRGETTRKTYLDRKIILEWILGEWGGKVWSAFVWFRIQTNGGLVNTVMSLRVPHKAVNFLTSRVTISFARRSLLHGVGQSISNLCGALKINSGSCDSKILNIRFQGPNG